MTVQEIEKKIYKPTASFVDGSLWVTIKSSTGKFPFSHLFNSVWNSVEISVTDSVRDSVYRKLHKYE